MDQLQHPDMGEGDTAVNEGIEEDTVATMSGYTTVALFGLDTVSPVSLVKETEAIRLLLQVSIMILEKFVWHLYSVILIWI